jgi:hypothetical protein
MEGQGRSSQFERYSMTPTYDWVCKYCGSPNLAHKANCAACFRLAWASPKEVDKVGAGDAPSPADETWDEMPESVGLKVVWFLFIAAGVVGILLGKFGDPIWLNFLGLVITLVGIGGAWLVSKKRK